MHFISAVCSERGAMVREWVSKTTLTKMSSHHREEAVHHHQMPLLVCFVLLSVAQEASHFSECMSNVWQVFLLPFVDSGKYPSWNSLEILYFLPPFEARNPFLIFFTFSQLRLRFEAIESYSKWCTFVVVEHWNFNVEFLWLWGCIWRWTSFSQSPQRHGGLFEFY